MLGKTQLICSSLAGDSADLVSVIGLLRRWSCTGQPLHICSSHLGDKAHLSQYNSDMTLFLDNHCGYDAEPFINV